jgi:DNA invertase Pin-like site-specific DNA recombinase
MASYTSFDALRSAKGPRLVPTGIDGKQRILLGGKAIRVRKYSRASHDPGGSQSSVGTQDRRSDGKIQQRSWSLIDSYCDNNRPASRRARKLGRPDYERMLEDIAADPGDVIVMFEIARGSRDLAVYVNLRDTCFENGPYYWMVGENLFDVRDRQDRQTLNNLASQAEGGSDATAEAVLAGLETQALEGRPHGPTPFGYLRLYKDSNGKYDRQVFDESDCGGWTPADVVRGIFAGFLAGVPILHIVFWLNEMGVPTPRTYGAIQRGDRERAKKWEKTRWRDTCIHNILGNISYVGARLHKGTLTKENCWPALIDEDTFFAAGQKLGRQRHLKFRPASAQSLLTCLARCQCGDEMVSQSFTETCTNRQRAYRCRKGDSAVPADAADQYVEYVVMGWFTDPSTADLLRRDDSGEKAAAQAKADRLREELASWKRLAMDAARHDVQLDDYNEMHKKMWPRICEAETLATQGLPRAVKEMAGPGAVGKWRSKTLAEQRELLREAARIVVFPAGRGCRNARIQDRVQIAKAF